jgi:hypothetical protein
VIGGSSRAVLVSVRPKRELRVSKGREPTPDSNRLACGEDQIHVLLRHRLLLEAEVGESTLAVPIQREPTLVSP